VRKSGRAQAQRGRVRALGEGAAWWAVSGR
jgi:hypothetical protein